MTFKTFATACKDCPLYCPATNLTLILFVVLKYVKFRESHFSHHCTALLQLSSLPEMFSLKDGVGTTFSK